MHELRHLQNHVSTQQQNILRGSEIGMLPIGVVHTTLSNDMEKQDVLVLAG